MDLMTSDKERLYVLLDLVRPFFDLFNQRLQKQRRYEQPLSAFKHLWAKNDFRRNTESGGGGGGGGGEKLEESTLCLL
jgi:hypothetical protein